MGRKKKSAAEVSADHLAEVTRRVFEGLDHEYADAVESAKIEREAARGAVKWAHSRFAVSADALARVVGDESVPPEDVGRYLKATTRGLKRLKAMIALADDVFDETDEVLEFGGLDE